MQALDAYDGTIVFVSHDRWFVSRLASRIVEIRSDGIEDFVGGYDEYVERCGDDHLDAEVVLRQARRGKRRRKASSRGSAGAGKAAAALEKERDRLTAAIESAEARVHEINEIFCDPTYYERTPSGEVQKLEREQRRHAAEVERLVEEWGRVEEELARLAT